MKCPKCGYVGFERVDKCRNCGYHFSLADAAPELELSLGPDAPVEAPPDLDLRIPDTPVAQGRGRAPEMRNPPMPPAGAPVEEADRRVGADDLPLFGADPGHATRGDGPADIRALTRTLRGRIAASTPSGDAVPAPPPGGPRLRPRAERYRPPSLTLEPDLSADAPGGRRVAASGPRMAGPLARAVAGLLDGLILGALNLGVLYFTLRVCRLSFAEIGQLPPAPLIGFFLLLDGAYLVAFTAHGGQTIGKMAAGIRVVGDDGDDVMATQAMVRAGGYLASLLPAGLGFVPGLFGPARRALHDRLANTRVIKA